MTEASLWGLHVLCCALLGVSSSSAGETRHRYVVHHDAVAFDDALSQCSHSGGGGGGGGGVLTTLATQQEVRDVLAAVSPSLPDGPPGGHNFWLGLRKAKTDCVVPHLPLKGFKWTADGSETTQVHGGYRWRKEPPETCTALRCLMLSMESREDWALTDSSCKARHPFICKYVAAEVAEVAPAETDGRQETRDVDVETSDPVTRLPATPPQPDAGPTTTPTPVETPTSSPPEQPTQPPHAPPTQPPPPPPPPPPSSSSQPQPQPHPELEVKGDCRDAPIVNGSRSLRQHPDQPGRMTLECWSGEEVELNCSEATTGGRWEVAGSGALLERLLDDVCARCDHGFEKDDVTWTCRDVDECQSAPCGGGDGGTCVNTPGSYRCVCYDARGAAHDEGSAACVAVTPGGGGGGAEVETADHGAQSGILVPALIAAAVLLLLLAVGGVVAVRCCLAKRAKRRAAEKEDDKMAMDAAAGRHKDAMETTNEKEAI